MKRIVDYIKEALDYETIEYKLDVWFRNDKKHYDSFIDFVKNCQMKLIVQKDDVVNFLNTNPEFKLKEFIDFIDDDIVRSEDINKDYIYQFTKIIEMFLTNFNLRSKIDNQKQTEELGKAKEENQ